MTRKPLPPLRDQTDLDADQPFGTWQLAVLFVVVFVLTVAFTYATDWRA